MQKTPTFFRRSYLLLFLLASGVLLLSKCMNKEEGNTDKEHDAFSAYAGSATCQSCHNEVYRDHVQTAHFRTSQPATDTNILGSFAPGSNAFHFNDHLFVAMEERNDRHYQVAYQHGKEKLARRMDIVVGSGTMGQSFLNWRGLQLYQLPITFFSAANMWSNSPGFPNKVVFNRGITSRCMECHTTFMQTVTPPGVEPEAFDRNKIIFGVDCEKCHGPAAQHVSFHQQHPREKQARHIVNPASLPRQQQLDLCALCHGGSLQKTTPSFSFKAGNNLNDHFLVDTTVPDPAQIDVHGNQYGLLRASKCFTASTTLTCNSCHDTHKRERGNLTLFSQRCMECHQPEHANFCSFKALPATTLAANCIDCHMPLQPSRAIAVFLPGKASPTAASIRSHYITINKEATDKHLTGLSSLPAKQEANRE